MHTLEEIETQHKKSLKTIKDVKNDQQQILEISSELDTRFDNILEMIMRSKKLKKEIQSMPRPVIDENG